MPRRLKSLFAKEDEVETVPEAGLSGFSNGRLLRRIDGVFDVFVTVDKSIQYQQTLSAYDIAFVLLRARSNDVVDVAPLVAKLLTRFDELRSHALLIID